MIVFYDNIGKTIIPVIFTTMMSWYYEATGLFLELDLIYKDIIIFMEGGGVLLVDGHQF